MEVPSLKHHLRRIVEGLALPATVVLLWFFLAGQTANSFLLPGPGRVWRAGAELWQSGRLLRDLLASLGRVGVGFLLAAVLGLPLGFLIARRRTFARIARGGLDFLRQIPPVALVPVLLLWLGLGEGAKLFVIVYAAFFPILLAAELGVRQVDPDLIEMGRLYHRRSEEIVWRVIVPYALPAMATGLRLGLGYGWRSLVVAEMLAAARGLGALIVEARGFGRVDQMLVGVLAIGGAGLLLDWLLRLLESALPWSGREGGAP